MIRGECEENVKVLHTKGEEEVKTRWRPPTYQPNIILGYRVLPSWMASDPGGFAKWKMSCGPSC
jgi:hypothetical protein